MRFLNILSCLKLFEWDEYNEKCGVANQKNRWKNKKAVDGRIYVVCASSNLYVLFLQFMLINIITFLYHIL